MNGILKQVPTSKYFILIILPSLVYSVLLALIITETFTNLNQSLVTFIPNLLASYVLLFSGGILLVAHKKWIGLLVALPPLLVFIMTQCWFLFNYPAFTHFIQLLFGESGPAKLSMCIFGILPFISLAGLVSMQLGSAGAAPVEHSHRSG